MIICENFGAVPLRDSLPLASNIPTIPLQNNNPEIVILKAIDSQEEMTISDIVINTELSPALVKEILLYLESEQLIYGYIRETDGAVVYKNI